MNFLKHQDYLKTLGEHGLQQSVKSMQFFIQIVYIAFSASSSIKNRVDHCLQHNNDDDDDIDDDDDYVDDVDDASSGE